MVYYKVTATGIKKQTVTAPKPSKPSSSASSSTSAKVSWVNHTKEYAKLHQVSYKEALSNPQNRIEYHRQDIDKSKVFRGDSLLPLDHPAMCPATPGLSKEQKKVEDEIRVSRMTLPWLKPGVSFGY